MRNAKLGAYVLSGAIALALAGCGGGSSPPTAAVSDPSPPTQSPPTEPTADTISGVAAVGAPLAGSVTIKDATGATKTVAIGDNGAYTVDVTGMTAPFVFRAQGTANGQIYTVHSAAASADVNGTINITQLTELMIDNIAGQLATNYFDSGDFSTLSKASLDAEADRLKEKLLPVLTALGVSGSVDLLRTQFTPLSSALDSALDVLRVSVDQDGTTARITNIVTQQQLVDDLTVTAAGEASPAQLTETTGLSEAPSDIALVKGALAQFSAKLANGLPSQASVLASLTSTFLNDDQDGASFAADVSSDSGLVGAKFTDVDVVAINYDDPNGPTARVNFTVIDANGVERDRVSNFGVRKVSDGVWRLQGNNHMLSVSGNVHTFRGHRGGVCTLTGLEFLIEDLDETNDNNLEVDHISVFGPGLPGNGLRYNPPSDGGYWKLQGKTNSYYVMGNSCQSQQAASDSVIASIPDNAKYLVIAFSSVDNSVRVAFPSGAINGSNQNANGAYLVTIEKRPLTLAEAVASTLFPNITSPTSSVAFDGYTSGTLTITADNMNPSVYADIQLQQNTQSGDFRAADDWLAPGSNGSFTTTLSLTSAAQGDPITLRNLYVATQDAYRRTFMTGY